MNVKPKRPTLISIASSKGGVGKSTLTTILASYYHYKERRKCVIIDCDHPQHSLAKYREREMETIKTNDRLFEAMLAQEDRTELSPYPVLNADVERAPHVISDFMSRNRDLELVFCDLPGTLQAEGLVNLISMMDYLFVPITSDMMDINAGVEFITIINEWIDQWIKEGYIKNSNLKRIIPFWNKVDKREKTTLYAKYDTYFEEIGFPCLKSKIYQLIKFRKETNNTPSEILKSTVFPPSTSVIYQSGIDSLTSEIIELINQ